MLVTGFSIALVVEWVDFYGLNRWSYPASMPLLPGSGISKGYLHEDESKTPHPFWRGHDG